METPIQTQVSSDTWDIYIKDKRSSDTGPSITIEAKASGNKIRNLYIQRTKTGENGAGKTRLVIRGPVGNEDWLESVDRIWPAQQNGTLVTKGLVTVYELRTNGDVGDVRVPRISGDDGQVVSGGDVTGGFFPISPDEDEDGTYTYVPEVILDNITIQGDLLGDIDIDAGRIQSIIVDGSIGASGSPVTIEVSDTINELVAAEIYADISFDGDFRGGLGGDPDEQGWVHNIEVTDANGAGFVGTLTCNQLDTVTNSGNPITDPEPGITIAGDLDGELIFFDDVNAPIVVEGGVTPGSSCITVYGDLLDTGTTSPDVDILVEGDLDGAIEVFGECAGNISIGGDHNGVSDIGTLSGSLIVAESLASGGLINIDDADGLEGQIIIDGDDTSGSSIWSDDVIVDTDTFGPGESQPFAARYYEEVSANFGGGAIGEVPFDIHHEDCDPAEGDTVVGTSGGGPWAGPALVRFYGPVRSNSSPSTGFTVERKHIFGGGSWTDVTGSHTLSFPTPGTPGIDGRTVEVEGSFPCGYKYRVTPNDEVLCAGSTYLNGHDVTVLSGCQYTFNVLCFTSMDRSGNGIMDAPDVVIQVEDPIDLNGDSVADGVDLALIVDAVVNGN